jgi:hypothetical protein
MPDVGIQGLVYALPDSGDRLVLFQLDLKLGSKSKSGEQIKPTPVGPKIPKQGFA